VTVFGEYSRYYQLLYQEKDYPAEAAYVLQLIRAHCPWAQSLLDLGCGTGAHAQHLAEREIRVHGIDCSAKMLEQARNRQKCLPEKVAERLTFSEGDVRQVRMADTFDAVISLFHVASYQTDNEDLRNMFLTARKHLKPGGVFVFDCWYGPAVLRNLPAVRIKRMEDHAIEVKRIAEPVMHFDRNVVDVNYTVCIRDKADDSVIELKEVHVMRYLFSPEVELFAGMAGMKIVDSRSWLSGNIPSVDSWNVCFTARA
jgi:SAM-dependent methyltransferase